VSINISLSHSRSFEIVDKVIRKHDRQYDIVDRKGKGRGGGGKGGEGRRGRNAPTFGSGLRPGI